MAHSSRWVAGLMIAGVATAAACGDDTGSGGAGGSGGDDKTTTTTTTGTTKTTTTTTATTTATTTNTTTTNTTGMGGMAEGGGGSGQGGMAEGGGGAGQGGSAQGGGGAGQGGSGQGGGAMASGETCGDAIVAADGSYVGTYTGFANDYNPTGTGCTGYAEVGADIAYQVTIPAGEELQAILFPDTADAALYLVTDCAMLSTCLEGTDAGNPEELYYVNNGATPLTAFLIVDSYNATDSGGYTLQINTGDETTCNDFFDNDVDGEIDCGDATACSGTAACTPGAGVTGVACAANTACAAVGGDPACLQLANGFPGGYCSEWCNLAADDCSGDAICLDVGANDGLCFDGCTVDGDCRSGYYCDVDICLPTPTECATPITAMLGANTGTTIGAPNELSSTCDDSDDGAEHVYSFTPATTGTMTLTLSSATDQGLSVRSPGCPSAADELACVDSQFGGTDEVLTQAVTAGTTYYLVVTAYASGDEGAYTLTVAVN